MSPTGTQPLLASSCRRLELLPAKAKLASPKPPALGRTSQQLFCFWLSVMEQFFPGFPADFLICSSISVPWESWRDSLE